MFDDLWLKNDRKFHQRQFFIRFDTFQPKNLFIFLQNITYLRKKMYAPDNCTVQDTIRCTVLEMWNQGEKLACGLVTQDTKVWRPLQ